MSRGDSPQVLIGRDADQKASHLTRVSRNDLNWTTLYRDPFSGQLWKKSYPRPEAHASGPSKLETISRERALLEFDVVEEDLTDPAP